MKRSLVFIVIFIFLVSLLTVEIGAQVLVVNEKGQTVVRVLAEKDEIGLEVPSRSLEVKEVANKGPMTDAVISLNRDNEKGVSLTVESKAGKNEMNLAEWKGNLVEIEERAESQKVIIGTYENKFSLQQKGVVAVTEFPISINAKSAKISVKTASGERYIAVLPKEAVDGLLRAKVISSIPYENILEISEEDNVLYYQIPGNKILNVLNLFDYVVPVKGKVSALNGEIVSVEQPTWLKIFGFLFS